MSMYSVGDIGDTVGSEVFLYRDKDFGLDYSTVADPLPFSSQARARLSGTCSSTRVL